MSKPWKKIKEEKYKAGYRNMLKRTFELPDGTVADYDIKDDGEAVCILALTTDDQVIFAEQFRPGPEKVLLELPGGNFHGNETQEEAIKRELYEETGYTGDIQFIGTTLDDAYSNMVRYNYVATNCHKVSEPQNHEGEFTEVVLMPFEEFRRELRKGQFTDVETAYLGLDFLGML